MKNCMICFFISMCFLANGQSFKVIKEDCISSSVTYAINEPHMISNPNDYSHLAIATIVTKKWERGTSPDAYIALFQSRNAGENWTVQHFDEGFAFGADPWLAMNSSGTMILTGLMRKDLGKRVKLFVLISRDSGLTWTDSPIDLGPGHDRQSVVVHPESGEFIIVSGQFNVNSDGKDIAGISTTRLRSNGTFRESNWHAISNIDKNNGTPLITPEGHLIVPFVDYAINNKRVQMRRNWIISSNDLGRTFNHPILLSEGGRFPQILMNTTDTNHKGLIYMQSTGGPRQFTGFEMSVSRDMGYTWSPGTSIDQFKGENPYIRTAEWVMDNEGRIGVAWYDRRDDPDRLNQHIYFSSSTDEGVNFEEPSRVTSVASLPSPEKNGMVDQRWPTGGDYFGLVSTDKGIFQLAWIDHRNGTPQLFFGTLSTSKE